MLIRLFLCTTVLFIVAGCGPSRSSVASPELEQRALLVNQRQTALINDALDMVLQRLEDDRIAGRAPCLDILMLSGGGSWGAFGAGFLHGWSELPSDRPLAMPKFDVVSGVSTGALISPYALIGTEKSLSTIEKVYRSSQENWAPMMSLIDIVGSPSLCDTTILDKHLRDHMNAELANELLRIQETEHRQAFVASSDIDLGRPIIWRLGDQARKGLASTPYNSDPLFNALRSSAAIPGAFSPVEVDGSLHVDGAIYGQIHVLADLRMVEKLLTTWRQKAGPEAPLPKIRYWVILNNRLKVDHKTIQPKWSNTSLRSIELMLSAQIAAPLNRLALFVENMRHKYGIDAELRWVQIPSTWKSPPDVTEFHPSVTNGLCDLGLSMGRDSSSWRSIEELAQVNDQSDGDIQPDKP